MRFQRLGTAQQSRDAPGVFSPGDTVAVTERAWLAVRWELFERLRPPLVPALGGRAELGPRKGWRRAVRALGQQEAASVGKRSDEAGEVGLSGCAGPEAATSPASRRSHLHLLCSQRRTPMSTDGSGEPMPSGEF